MDQLLITIITIAAVLAATAVAALLYWYAFRFEPVNFVLSRIRINLAENDLIKNGPKGKNLKENCFSNHVGFIQRNEGARKNSRGVKLFSVLHLSDFHLRKDRTGMKLVQFIESLKKLKPDFIFITGDLIEKDEHLPLLSDMLSGLKARIGMFAVLGVHDYFNKSPGEFLKNMLKRKKEYKKQNDVGRLIQKLSLEGIKVLRNESVILDSGSGPACPGIQIAGIEDSIIRKADIEKTFQADGNAADSFTKYNNQIEYKADLKAGSKNNVSSFQAGSTDRIIKSRIAEAMRLSGRKEHTLNCTGKIVICLTHTPDQELLTRLSSEGADIIFSGHTHGGQVRLPVIGALLSGCNIKTKYASGLFYFRKFVLYVSRGLGEGRYSPFRFYCQPEATLINVFYQ